MPLTDRGCWGRGLTRPGDLVALCLVWCFQLPTTKTACKTEHIITTNACAPGCVPIPRTTTPPLLLLLPLREPRLVLLVAYLGVAVNRQGPVYANTRAPCADTAHHHPTPAPAPAPAPAPPGAASPWHIWVLPLTGKDLYMPTRARRVPIPRTTAPALALPLLLPLLPREPRVHASPRKTMLRSSG
jgi:hypothetical protein